MPLENYEKYTLEELSIEYVRFLELWYTGNLYTNRTEIHDEIFKRLGLNIYERGDEIEANRILHNLDKEIGYKIGFEYDDAEIERMGKRLAKKFRIIKEVKYENFNK